MTIASLHPSGDNWAIVVDGQTVGIWHSRETAERLVGVINRAARRDAGGLFERAAHFLSSHVVEDHAAMNAPFPSNVVQLRRKG